VAALEAAYGTSNQSLTISANSLANNAARSSAAVDNSANKFLDALIMPTIVTGASGTSASGYVNVYAYGSVNGGSSFGGESAGTDAAVTLTSPPNTRLIGVVNCVANSTTYRGPIMNVAAAFGGILPERWGIILENKTGGTLGSGSGVVWQGVEGAST
jgi:hypothetical protein